MGDAMGWGAVWLQSMRSLRRGRAERSDDLARVIEVQSGCLAVDVPPLYTVRFEAAPLAPSVWADGLSRLARDAGMAALLRCGQVPFEVNAWLLLIPPPSDVTISCTCGDAACSHASQAAFALARAFDGDPFILLAWRGRPRTAVMTALQRRPAVDARTFWCAGACENQEVEAPPSSDAEDGGELRRVLEPAYAAIRREALRGWL